MLFTIMIKVRNKMLLLIIVSLLAMGLISTAKGMSVAYYAVNCPMADMIVRNVVNRALRKDPTLSAPLLRMHFHDCFVEGCDGSILIDSTKDNTAEKDSIANLSLRGFEVIDAAKNDLEDQCPGVVSCADIVAMAARDAIFFAGGPLFEIPKGRRDGRRSMIQDAFRLPPPFLNATELIRAFGQKGFTVQDVVALSGAHTIGVARCAFFKNRLKNFDSTHDVDPSLSSSKAEMLSKTCAAGDNAEATFDRTRTSFDNDYYMGLQSGAGLLASDQTLYNSPRTRGFVNAYATNTARFFMDFLPAMLKMGQLDIKEGDEGEVRLNCRRIN